MEFLKTQVGVFFPPVDLSEGQRQKEKKRKNLLKVFQAFVSERSVLDILPELKRVCRLFFFCEFTMSSW